MFKKFAIFIFAITVAAPPALLNASDDQESQRPSANEPGRTCTDTSGNPEACPPDPEGILAPNGKTTANPNGVGLRSLSRNLVQDQKNLWTAPAHFQKKDIKWIGPFAGVTAG